MKPIEPIEISIGTKIQDPRFPGKTPEQSWILDLGSEPRLKFQSVQSVSIGIQDSANRPLGRFPPLPKDLPNSMSVIALILVDLWGGGTIYIYICVCICICVCVCALLFCWTFYTGRIVEPSCNPFTLLPGGAPATSLLQHVECIAKNRFCYLGMWEALPSQAKA